MNRKRWMGRSHFPSDQEYTLAMSSIRWLPDNTTHTKAKLDAASKAGALGFGDAVATLKGCNHLSSIVLLVSLHCERSIIDSLVDLLKTNPNIKHLEIRVPSRWNDRRGSASRAYLLKALTNDHQVGEGLESLRMRLCWEPIRGIKEPVVLWRYLKSNRNLKRLSIGELEGPMALKMVSSLSSTGVTHLCFKIGALRPDSWIQELCTRLGQCHSILSLEIRLQGYNFFTYFTSHQMGVFLRSLAIPTHLQQFTLRIPDKCYSVNDRVLWYQFGTKLSSVKSVSLNIEFEDALLAVLPHLQSCESLVLRIWQVPFQSIGPILSSLENLKAITIVSSYEGPTVQNKSAFLDMIKANKSITKARWTFFSAGTAFQDKADSLCIVNRVFSTNLISFEASELWTIGVLPKMTDPASRTHFLYRLLREKPELLLCTCL